MAKKKPTVQQEIESLKEMDEALMSASAEMFGVIGKDMGGVQRGIASTQAELDAAKKRISELESINLEKKRSEAWEATLADREARGEIRTYRYDGGSGERIATFQRNMYDVYSEETFVQVVRLTQKPGQVSINTETTANISKSNIAKLGVFMPRVRVVAGILIGIGLTLIGVAVF